MISDKRILLGFYQGLGDFVSAVPVMNQLLEQGNRLIIAASRQNVMLAKTIEFKGEAVEFLDYSLFSLSRPGVAFRFVRQLIRAKPDLVYLSPHAQYGLSSWKLPILLAFVRRLFWRRGSIIGAENEKCSRLFDLSLPVDKSLDLLHREWSLHTQAGSIIQAEPPSIPLAIDWKLDRPKTHERPELVIHPGASKSVRLWPVENYVRLIELLEDSQRIVVIGLEHELAPLRQALSHFGNVTFYSGSLAEVLAITAAGQMVVTMDSGFSHLAAFLDVNHLAIFGASSPDIHGPFTPKSELMFNPTMPCQPCDQYICQIGEATCMETISPQMVVDHLERVLALRQS